MPTSIEHKRALIEPEHPDFSLIRQCELLELNRSTWYYRPATETAENLELMQRIDKLYLRMPFLGSRRIAAKLSQPGREINRKRIQRLMHTMGLEAIHPKPRTSRSSPEHKIYPYLLRNLAVTRPNQVWCADITYIPMPAGFMYLVAIMDWYSRYVIGWRLSNTLDARFCLETLEEALIMNQPTVFNTDQGVQFTARRFTKRLEDAQVAVSMDGRGRMFDNIFIERLWRSLKYEDVYIKEYATVPALEIGLTHYFDLYNCERPHQALGYATPADYYFADTDMGWGKCGQLKKAELPTLPPTPTTASATHEFKGQ